MAIARIARSLIDGIRLTSLGEVDVGMVIVVRGDYDRFYPLALFQEEGIRLFTGRLTEHALDIVPLATGDTLTIVDIRRASAPSFPGFEEGNMYRKADTFMLILTLHNGERPVVGLTTALTQSAAQYTLAWAPDDR